MPSYTIPGGVVLCDKEDAQELLTGGWRVNCGRVVKKITKSGKYLRVELFHREILGCPSEKVVDHINGNTLDNRRVNLRTCTEQQNRWNRKVHSNNASGIRGIYCEPLKGGGVRWRAQIRKNGKTYRLGSFRSAKEAQEARVEAEKKLFGEYAPCLCRAV